MFFFLCFFFSVYIYLLEPTSSISSTIVDKYPLTSSKHTSNINEKKMATTATLTAVSTSNPSNSNNNTDNNKRKSEENLGPSTNRKPIQRRQIQTDTTKMKSSIDIDDNDGLNKTNSVNRTGSTFRIPKLGR